MTGSLRHARAQSNEYGPARPISAGFRPEAAEPQTKEPVVEERVTYADLDARQESIVAAASQPGAEAPVEDRLANAPEAIWLRPARTSSTIRRRTSAGYGGVDFGIVNGLTGPDRRHRGVLPPRASACSGSGGCLPTAPSATVADSYGSCPRDGPMPSSSTASGSRRRCKKRPRFQALAETDIDYVRVAPGSRDMLPEVAARSIQGLGEVVRKMARSA